MLTRIVTVFLVFVSMVSSGQEKALKSILSDSSMTSSSISLCILDTSNGETVCEYNSGESLIPASVLKLVTTSASLELLGPDYRFRTRLYYSGNLNRQTGLLKGNIVIVGGGDPALGSSYFREHYSGFLTNWITEIRKIGIKTVEGRIIVDDSRYNHQPVPPKWLWEDIGNYYGAGAYGLSIFDNTLEIHLKTSENGSIPLITRIEPEVDGIEITNLLISSGNSDKGYVFSAPYNDYIWMTGSVPENRDDFVLKASITDPPLLFAKLFGKMLDSAGIKVSSCPGTTRLLNVPSEFSRVLIDEMTSPPLSRIVEIINHQSINFFAEHLLKEMGKIFMDKGTTEAGIEVIYRFLEDSCIETTGMFLEDGSGMSPMNAVTSGNITRLLCFEINRAKYFDEFYNSLPEAGKKGTIKNYFEDPVFDSNLRAKSGSMTRVRSYAGYFRTNAGIDMAFCVIVNNFSGTSNNIIKCIEDILLETIATR
jgi:D-alanyl-D-alanine carboxypeptidase/D-alanyl-D-alanine-endopeptidase (penicillin-binding protein 4)